MEHERDLIQQGELFQFDILFVIVIVYYQITLLHYIVAVAALAGWVHTFLSPTWDFFLKSDNQGSFVSFSKRGFPGV